MGRQSTHVELEEIIENYRDGDSEYNKTQILDMLDEAYEDGDISKNQYWSLTKQVKRRRGVSTKRTSREERQQTARGRQQGFEYNEDDYEVQSYGPPASEFPRKEGGGNIIVKIFAGLWWLVKQIVGLLNSLINKPQQQQSVKQEDKNEQAATKEEEEEVTEQKQQSQFSKEFTVSESAKYLILDDDMRTAKGPVRELAEIRVNKDLKILIPKKFVEEDQDIVAMGNIEHKDGKLTGDISMNYQEYLRQMKSENEELKAMILELKSEVKSLRSTSFKDLH